MKPAAHAALLAVFALCGIPSAAARAETYQVVACADSQSRSNNSWTSSNSAPTKLEIGTACESTGPYSGLYVRDVLDVANAPPNSAAQWTFTAPPGTSITALAYSGWLYKEDDDDWQPALRLDGNVVATCAIVYPAVECSSGTQGGDRRSVAFGDGGSSLTIGVVCNAPAGSTCVNGAAELHDAVAVLYGATVTLSDPSAPTISNTAGSLLSGGYLTGDRSVTFDASDNAGVRSARIYIDGSVRASTTYACDFTYAVPCSNKSAAALSVDTRLLSDGSHSVQVAASDPAGNEAKSASRMIRVDNNAPAAPRQLGVVGGQDWRSTNSFSVTWTNPVDAGSAVAIARYQLCSLDGSACQPSEQVAGTGVSRIDGLSVPSEGEWSLRVWLEDAAGNVEPANVATTILRYGSPPVTSTPPTTSSPPDISPTSPPSDATTGTAPLVDPTASFTTITAPPPSQTSVFRRDPGLRLTTARLSRNRLVIRGRLAAIAPTRIVFTIRTRSGQLVRRTVRIRHRRFSASLAVRNPRGRITARFSGDAAFRPASASVRISR